MGDLVQEAILHLNSAKDYISLKKRKRKRKVRGRGRVKVGNSLLTVDRALTFVRIRECPVSPLYK